MAGPIAFVVALSSLVSLGGPASAVEFRRAGPDPSAECTIVSEERVIRGTDGGDVICVTGSASTRHVVQALAGDDVVIGGPGIETVNGGSGNDYLVATGAGDRLIGAAGEDECVGTNANCEVVHRPNDLAPDVEFERVDDEVMEATTDPETGTTDLILPADAPVEVGYVVNSGPTAALPKGVLGRITAIDRDGSVIRARTEPVSLPEIIPFGELTVEFEPGTDVPVTEGETDLRTMSAMAASSAAASDFKCGASSSAEVSVDAGFSHAIDAGAMWIPFRPPAAYFNGRATVGGDASFIARAGAECAWKKHIDGPTLGTKVMVVGPVVVVFSLESGVDLDFEANADANIRIAGDIDYGAEFLASLHDDNFTYGMFPVKEASLTHKVDGEIRSRLDVMGSISLEAYGATGPAVYMGGFIDAAAYPQDDPWFVIDGGVIAGVDFVFDVWRVHEKYTVARKELTRFNITTESGTFPGPAISATPLPEGTVGQPYSAALQATGGTAPLDWSSTSLPDGLTLNSDGTISGTPTEAWNDMVYFMVTDGRGYSDTEPLLLRINGEGGTTPPPAVHGTTTRVSVGFPNSEAREWGMNGSISADGRYTVFESSAINAGDNSQVRDVFLHDAVTGDTIRVSETSFGGGNGDSYKPKVSANGRYVTYESAASNLVPGDTNQHWDVFSWDRETKETLKVSVGHDGQPSNGSSGNPTISADGRYIAYGSGASNLVEGDYYGGYGYVWDRVTGTTVRAVVALDGGYPNGSSSGLDISGDGRYVTYSSSASNVVANDPNGWDDVFLWDRITGETVLVSAAPDGATANGASYDPRVSSDGRYVTYTSWASNLVTGDTNGIRDVFVWDRATGRTMRASVASDGAEANSAGMPGPKDSWISGSEYPAISGDGRYVTFTSWASNLVTGDANATRDVFVWDRQTGGTARVSVAPDGTDANNWSDYPAISASGRHVVYHSVASNLVHGDTNDAIDVFVWRRS